MCRCQFNILVDSHGRAFVRGTSLSTMLDEIAESEAYQAHPGDVHWTAPELVIDMDSSSGRLPTSKSDVWSFGCIMIHVNHTILCYSHNHLKIVLGAFRENPLVGYPICHRRCSILGSKSCTTTPTRHY
jgi:serine/threonine protein kinase